jgi:hypothetical protein
MRFTKPIEQVKFILHGKNLSQKLENHPLKEGIDFKRRPKPSLGHQISDQKAE